MGEFGVSRRTVARDLDFLRNEERTPMVYEGSFDERGNKVR